MFHFYSEPPANFYLIIWAPFNYTHIQFSGAYPELVIITVTFCKTLSYEVETRISPFSLVI